MSTDTDLRWLHYSKPKFFARDGAPRSSFKHRLYNGIILVVDKDEDGAMSVTNDAERVVAHVIRCYGNYPIIYRDSTGRWDKLLHENGVFTDFGLMPPCFKIDHEAGA